MALQPVENPVPLRRRRRRKGVVAEAGFEPCDLEGMNLASYRAALLRDMDFDGKVRPALSLCKTECKNFTLCFLSPSF